MSARPGDLRGARATQRIFSGIASAYDAPAQIFGLLRYRSWHRALVATLADEQPRRVLDMCTGTGPIAAEILARTGARVIAADVTRAMLERARLRPALAAAGARVRFVQADAQAPPFAEGAFDAVVWSFLLRYVHDVPATLRALGSLVRPGGVMASLEFGVPRAPLARAAWELYTRAVLPAGLALVSPGWRHVGGFLGASIRAFDADWPEARLHGAWRDAGFGSIRTRRLSLGGAVILSGRRTA
jgi:demethylmenaquinone methyltransferase/2-methoxy-6-polyprenyl-1,4-benzoquinol methylase